MNNIVRYNTFLLNQIIIAVLLILIGILGYKIWTKYVGKKLRIKFGLSKKEDFSQVTLEKQVQLYDDYRNYLEGKDLLTKKCSTNRRMLPYIVSPSCFTDKYVSCMKEKALSDAEAKATPVTSSVYDHMHTDERLDGFNTAFDDKYLDPSFYETESDSVSHNNIYDGGFQAISKKCQDQSYDMCLTDNFNFL